MSHLGDAASNDLYRLITNLENALLARYGRLDKGVSVFA